MAASLLNTLLIGVTGVLTCFFLFVIIIPDQYDPYLTDQNGYDEDELMRARMSPDNSGKTLKKIKAECEARREKAAVRSYSTSVTIVVLGDIGRSPRMQYHAMSLVDRGAYVHLVGYVDSDLHPDLRKSIRVRVSSLRPTPRFLYTSNKALFALFGPLKVIWQALALVWILAYTIRPTKYVLVQNPPSIPVLAIARTTSFIRNSRLVIDWHNFGWSMLALKLGNSHPLVRLSEIYEIQLGKTADKHFAVTEAMARYLDASMGVKALPLHDRPASDFKPLAVEQWPLVYQRLELTGHHAKELEAGSMRLLVSSTSWTPDEDFSLLLEALVSYAKRPNSPKILLVITGNGPQKQHYIDRIEALTLEGKLKSVIIKTAFLSFADYAALLSAAHLGICLHQSTSGLDLPMKVVDMFGAGLPVIGWSKYETWPELVTEGVNGMGFQSQDQLTELLVELLSSKEKLAVLRDGALKESQQRWKEEWDTVAANGLFFSEQAKRK